MSFNAEFLISITQLSKKPEDKLPEIAFVGRSNVGKSSLMNSLFNRKNLVKTSSTPGKTQLINYFIVNKSVHFVDLPGYGFAKIPKNMLEKWRKMLEGYIENSEELRLVCLLIDSRHNLMEKDKQMAEWLNYLGTPFVVILTKTDKLPRNKVAKQKKYFSQYFQTHHIFPVSTKDKNSIKLLEEHLKLFFKID
jgi:GTP-binding protein